MSEDEFEAARRTLESLTLQLKEWKSVAPSQVEAMVAALAELQREISPPVRSPAQDQSVVPPLYDGSPDPLLTLDEAAVVRACNRAASRWLGGEHGDLIGQPIAGLFETESKTWVQWFADNGWTGVAEKPLRLLDGRSVGLNVRPVSAGPGPRRFHLTLQDITNRQVLAQAAAHRKRMEALAGLAGAIARELNDPMSIVQGRMELLLELGAADPDAVKTHLSVALDHARRVSATLRNLRLVGQSAAPQLERVLLSDVLDDGEVLLGTRARKGRIERSLDPEDIAVGGDQAMYARVVADLMRRALDSVNRATPVRLTASRTRDHVKLEITTWTGRPVTAQAPGGDEGDFLIARTLLDNVGGRLLSYRSTGGPVFELQLPFPPARRSRARPVEERVLAVGKERLHANLEALLDREGYEVVAARSAEDALQHLETEAMCAAVASELVLPGMSGLSLAEEIVRRWPRFKGRVLLITEVRLPDSQTSVVSLRPPLGRLEVLEALGRRVRRRS